MKIVALTTNKETRNEVEGVLLEMEIVEICRIDSVLQKVDALLSTKADPKIYNKVTIVNELKELRRDFENLYDGSQVKQWGNQYGIADINYYRVFERMFEILDGKRQYTLLGKDCHEYAHNHRICVVSY
jgi:hypothetical protein